MVEVEGKFRITDRSAIDKKLTKLGFSCKKTVHQFDKIFLVNSESFKSFKAGDPVVRIRIVDNKAKMTIKRTINKYGDSVEHEISVSPYVSAENFIIEMGYKEVTVVDKVRTEYQKDDIMVALDEVLRLGDFVEIEIICRRGEEDSARDRVNKIAKKLKLKENDIVTKKYDQLISELLRV